MAAPAPLNQDTEAQPQVLPHEFAIDKIVGHATNDDSSHPYAGVGEVLYRVRWTRYTAEDDTFEPINHIPRNAIVSYCNRNAIPLPVNINQAQVG